MNSVPTCLAIIRRHSGHNSTFKRSAVSDLIA